MLIFLVADKSLHLSYFKTFFDDFSESKQIYFLS